MGDANPTFAAALLAGGLAGMAVDTAFFPIDTLKTRLQAQEGFLRAGGFKGVYRGLGSAVVGSAPGAAAFFTSYELLKANLPALAPALESPTLAPVLHMLSASGGEIAACLIRVPTEVVKQRSQTAAAGFGSWDVAKSVWQSSGVRGFYRGYSITVAREVPFTCIQFPLYERMKLYLAQRRTESGLVRDLPASEAAICGSIAGGIAASLTTPLDVAKTRIMLSGRASVSRSSPQPLRSATATLTAHTSLSAQTAPPVEGAPIPRHYPTSFIKTLSIIYREEGPRALFAGVVPRVMWISLGGAVFLGVYEAAKKALAGRVTVVDKSRLD